MANDALYNSKAICPVCNNNIEVTKIKSKFIKVLSRDTDFCVHYEGLNPILYDPWVCEYCGYSALSTKFDNITNKNIIKTRKNLTKWTTRAFTGERNYNKALESFKLVLLNEQIIEAPSSDIAKVCLRIAWIFRYMENPKEIDFLKFSYEHYAKAYETERPSKDKPDQHTYAYLLAELSLRIGNYENSIKWFTKLFSFREAPANKNIIETARDRVLVAKELFKKSRSNSMILTNS